MYNPQLGSLQFPGKSLKGCTWYGLKLHQGWSQHDLAEIRIVHADSDESQFTTGIPVMFTFGDTDRLRTWTGYLHSVDRYSSGTTTERTLNCLGSSYSLSNSGQQSWSNITASAVVEQLCAAQGLASHTTPTSRVYEHINQAGLTAWELMDRLAHENGRFMFPDGVGVRFLSREAILSTFDLSTALPFYASRDRSTDVFSWRPVTSDDPTMSSERTAVKSYAGVDAHRGHVIRHVQGSSSAPHGVLSGAKLFFDAKTRVPVTSTAEAEALHQAASDISSWKYRVQARVRGSSSLESGLVIQLLGTGVYSGAWVVRDVVHTIEGGTYTCDLELVTDALGELPRQYRNAGTTPRPFQKATPVLRQAAKGAAFSTGQTRWQAQNRIPVQAAVRPAAASASVRRISTRGR